jgi:hypothetical protein
VNTLPVFWPSCSEIHAATPNLIAWRSVFSI